MAIIKMYVFNKDVDIILLISIYNVLYVDTYMYIAIYTYIPITVSAPILLSNTSRPIVKIH